MLIDHSHHCDILPEKIITGHDRNLITLVMGGTQITEVACRMGGVCVVIDWMMSIIRIILILMTPGKYALASKLTILVVGNTKKSWSSFTS